MLSPGFAEFLNDSNMLWAFDRWKIVVLWFISLKTNIYLIAKGKNQMIIINKSAWIHFLIRKNLNFKPIFLTSPKNFDFIRFNSFAVSCYQLPFYFLIPPSPYQSNCSRVNSLDSAAQLDWSIEQGIELYIV